MFILRRITEKGTQTNTNLGESYSYLGRIEHQESFDKVLLEYFAEVNDDIIYAFIICEGHNYPLYKGQKAYIMTESGKTFDNVSE